MMILLPLALLASASDWQSLSSWTPTPFDRGGIVQFEKDGILLAPGAPMTGITVKEFSPKINYEVRFEASRQRGNDFFASLTFPYLDSYATLVLGGWGGDIIGISSIDNWDASENETRAYFNFENERFYRIRIEVKEGRIRAWIDEKNVVDLAVNGRLISLRRGMAVTTPLSLFSYNTASRIRKIEFRTLANR
jgi:hypothetical protein